MAGACNAKLIFVAYTAPREAWLKKHGEMFLTSVAKLFPTGASGEQMSCSKEMAICEH